MALDVSVGLSSVVDDLLDFTKALRVPTLSQTELVTYDVIAR